MYINFLVKRNAWLVCIYQFVVSRFVEFFGNSMDRTVMKTSSLLSYLVGPRKKVPGFSSICPTYTM